MSVHTAADGPNNRSRHHAGHCPIRARPQKPIRLDPGLYTQCQRCDPVKNKVDWYQKWSYI